MPSLGRTQLIIVVLIFSAGVTPIAIRITQNEGMPSLVIVLIRLWLISFGLLPIVWVRYRDQLLQITMREWLLSAIAGFWLAVNLFTLFISLEYTTVLVSSVLRRTSPLWIILPEILLFGAVFSRRFWVSLVMTIIGVVLIGLGGLTAIQAGSDPLLGALLASFGAVCFGIYLLIGRKLNNTMPSLLYSFVVFLCSAIITSILVFATGTSVTGYPASGYVWTIIVTILAQVLGHVFINLGLQIFTATAMAVLLQIGVVVSAIIALFVFGEIPSLLQVIGSVLVVIGVILATIEQARWERKRKRVAS